MVDLHEFIQREHIEGTVQLKRKTTWVQRYAQIHNSILQYKEDRYSIHCKYQVDLRHSIVRKGTRNEGQGYYEIK